MKQITPFPSKDYLLTNRRGAENAEARQLLFLLPFYLLFLSLFSPAQAQIAPDGTLSTNVTTPNNLNFTINDGNRAGNNLFHSFREFSVPTGGEAFFNNAADVQNIFSRVTGGSISNIDGLIRANGAANLFLLNPNGIVFGPNAKLNLGGSFFASTARSLIFSDGTVFSTNPSQAAPLLTINVPIGLQYGGTAGQIQVQGSGLNFGLSGASGSFDSALNNLEVSPENTLALVGGNVIVDGGILQAPGGRVELGGLAGEGIVEINTDGSLSFPANVQRADVSIINKAGINVLAGGGGDIAIHAQNVEISGESLLTTGIATGLGTPGAKAGNIALDAAGAITITFSRLENNVNPEDISETSPRPAAIGDGGDILIQAGSIFTDTAQLSTGTFGQGNAGILFLEADSISITNGSSLQSSTSGIGNAGTVLLNSKGNVEIIGSKIESDIFNFASGAGNAGDIFVKAPGLVNVFDSEITSEVLSRDGAGNGGTIFISGGSISINQSSFTRLETTTQGAGNAGNIVLEASGNIAIARSIISSDTFGAGNAGTIILKANGAIDILSTDINSLVNSGSTGNGGIISIEGGSVSLTEGTQVQTSIFDGPQNAGNILINARDTVTITRSDILSSAEKGATGDAGFISINAGSIDISGDAVIDSGNFVNGNAGNIDFEAKDNISIINSTIASDAFNQETKAAGKFAGIITFTAGNSLVIGSDSKITADSFGGEEAETNENSGFGFISIKAGSVSLLNRALLSTNSFGSGAGGDIEINAGSISMTDAATVEALSAGTGDAGNITIKATDSVAISNSIINSTNFASGNAGNLTIQAGKNISISDKSSISSDTVNEQKNEAGGFAGDILITADDSFTIAGSQITAESFGGEKANPNDISGFGIISIQAKNVSLSELARLSTNTFGSGAGGNINIETTSFSVTGGSRVEAITVGAGTAGSILINASDSVTLSGVSPIAFVPFGPDLGGGSASGLYANANAEESGLGGSIEINTGTLRVADGAIVSARTLSTASGGDITINVNNFELTGGSQLLASSFGKGAAGSITLNAKNRVNISGSDSTYNARFNQVLTRLRELNLDFPEAAIQRLAQLTVDADSPNSSLSVNGGGLATGGNITISAPSIRLNRQAALTAETAFGNGGNITLRARNLLLLRRNSSISTTAGRAGAGGDGGNIEISTTNLVALENSDIAANAFTGRGGRVSITAKGIFGAQAGTQLTPKSDITAFSQLGGPQLSGTVELNTPDVDPSSGLVELPQTLVDVTGLVDQRCSPVAQQSTFIITGRGGLPPSPNEPLSDEAFLVNLVPINPESVSRENSPKRQDSTPRTEIVEAQGWVINEKGQVVLTAEPSTVTPHRPGLAPVECRVR